MIQDYILAILQWGLAVALIPTLLHPTEKPAFISSVWTGSLLTIMSITFATIELWSAAASSFTVALVWFTLGYQRYRINKRAGQPVAQVPYWLAYITPYF